MIVPLHNLKPGDRFLNLLDDCVYNVVSEPVDGSILCSDDEGFGEIFDEIHLVRVIFRQN